jgi:urease accessory protein
VDGTTASASIGTIPSAPSRAFAGAVEIAFRCRADRTEIGHLYQQSPLRALFPDTPDEPLPLAVLVNAAGGLVGGDRMSSSIRMEEGSAAVVTMQAAEKVYRSTGADTTVSNQLSVAPGAWLEWLPQETIVFDQARLRRTMRIDLEGDGAVLAGEILVFGRTARGERVTSGLVRDAWEVRHDGRLIWADALHLEDGIAAALADAACFDGCIGYATLSYAAGDAGEKLEILRAAIDGEGLQGATCTGPLLIARWLSREPHRLRESFARGWCALRQSRGLPARLPRIWHV